MKKLLPLFFIFVGVLILLGVVLRFYRITDNNFVFYDEGYYLNWSRPIGEILATHQLRDTQEMFQALDAFLSRSLASGKTLWFLLVDSRYAWQGLDHWSFGRLLAALLGFGTLALTYQFARKYFLNNHVALLATGLLAVLPSHVFYSRIGMQESLSTILVLAGFYFYTFPARFSWRAIPAGLFWGAAFFSNYRLIMLPVLMTMWELGLAFAQNRRPDVRKWLWAVLMFFTCVFLIGNFNHGENTYVIFSWVFHQAGMAQEQLDWFNVFSYPYYFFRLETFWFGFFFFASGYLLFKKERGPSILFALVLTQMAIFSLASEKGARYICVVLPFAVMVVAYFLTYLMSKSRDIIFQASVVIIAVLMLLFMAHKSVRLAQSGSDYQTSAVYIQKLSPGAKFLSSQPYVQNLFVKNRDDVKEVPAGFRNLLAYYKEGYRYMVLCPQAYISMTEDRKRFTKPLRSYLSMLSQHFTPQRTFHHLSPVLLERFVCDHNENLFRSIQFLKWAEQDELGVLRVYDLTKIVPLMLRALGAQAQELP